MDEMMQTPQPVERMDEAVAEQPKKKPIGAIIAIVAAVAILIGATIGGLATGWYGLAGGPLDGLLKAANKTFSAENLTVKFELDGEVDGASSGLSGEMKLALDTEKEELTAWLDGKMVAEELKTDIEALLADEMVYLMMTMSMDGETMENATTTEVDLDELWDYYEDVEKQEEIDWDDLLEKVELDEYVDADNVPAFIEKLQKDCLGNKEWLEKNLGFEKKGDTYRFDFEVDELLEELLDVADECDLFKSDVDDVEDALSEISGVAVELEMETKGGKLVAMDMEITVRADGETQQVSLSMDFTDIGSTKIAQDDIDDFSDEVKDWIEVHTCPDCGNTSSSYPDEECWYCYF